MSHRWRHRGASAEGLPRRRPVWSSRPDRSVSSKSSQRMLSDSPQRKNAAEKISIRSPQRTPSEPKKKNTAAEKSDGNSSSWFRRGEQMTQPKESASTSPASTSPAREAATGVRATRASREHAAVAQERSARAKAWPGAPKQSAASRGGGKFTAKERGDRGSAESLASTSTASSTSSSGLQQTADGPSTERRPKVGPPKASRGASRTAVQGSGGKRVGTSLDAPIPRG